MSTVHMFVMNPWAVFSCRNADGQPSLGAPRKADGLIMSHF
jgi:hypothetical protein